MGGQPLYIVNISAEIGDTKIVYPEFRYGKRTVKVVQTKIEPENITEDGSERLFAIYVNNVRTFCKGANWIPADGIYARVSDSKYESLIREACDANFNMLRI